MSVVEPVTRPDRRVFDAHASAPSFLAGVYRGDWSIEMVDWPTVIISVAAAPRTGAPDRFWLRCDCTNYPADGPTATPWDPETDAQLADDRRPKGDGVATVFRTDWEEGRALYAAYDRVALTSHRNWVTEYPRTAWVATRDLTWWTTRIWELLNNDDYLGI